MRAGSVRGGFVGCGTVGSVRGGSVRGGSVRFGSEGWARGGSVPVGSDVPGLVVLDSDFSISGTGGNTVSSVVNAAVDGRVVAVRVAGLSSKRGARGFAKVVGVTFFVVRFVAAPAGDPPELRATPRTTTVVVASVVHRALVEPLELIFVFMKLVFPSAVGDLAQYVLRQSTTESVRFSGVRTTNLIQTAHTISP